jgi:hypothetical protein
MDSSLAIRLSETMISEYLLFGVRQFTVAKEVGEVDDMRENALYMPPLVADHRHPDDGLLDAILAVNLGDGDLEPIAQLLFQALNHAALVLEALRPAQKKKHFQSTYQHALPPRL